MPEEPKKLTADYIPSLSTLANTVVPFLVREGEYAGRLTREWWAATDYGVEKTQGYSCRQSDVWWCPSVGFTGMVGHALFETEALALDAKIKELDLVIDKKITLRRDLISRRELLNE